MSVKVMLVDDSSIIRRLLGRVLDTDPDIVVAGQAENGEVALSLLDSVKPDVVILDIEMPVMDGLTTLPKLKALRPDLPVIMFSTLTESGAAATLEALMRGADDYVTKPSNTGSFDKTAKEITARLVPKIKALHSSKRVRHQRPTFVVRPAGPAPGTSPKPEARQSPPAPAPRPATGRAATPARRPGTRPSAPVVGRAADHSPAASRRSAPAPRARRSGRTARPELVVIGVSTGGPGALATVVPALPRDLGAGVLITQHMPPLFTKMLADRLDAQSQLSVAEAHEGAEVRPGHVWVAPGGSHLLVVRRAGQLVLTLDDGPPVHSCKPAVDPMFESAAAATGGRLLAIVLTGMGQDGMDGARVIRDGGGHVMAQDEQSSTVWGMPGHVVRAGLADEIVSLEGVAPAIAAHCGSTLTHPTSRPTLTSRS